MHSFKIENQWISLRNAELIRDSRAVCLRCCAYVLSVLADGLVDSLFSLG